MKISQKQTSLFTKETLTSLQEDSHVNHTHKQESDLGKRTADISGRKCSEQLKKLNQFTLWAKMFVDLLIGMEGWSSTKCVLTWKIVGTKYNRYYFQLVPSVRHIEEIEYGLLPTPQVMDIRTDTRKPQDRSEAANRGGCSNLREWTANGMLPTPRAAAAAGNTSNNRNKGNLEDAIAKMMLPTPQQRDWNKPENPKDYQKRKELWSKKGINLQLTLPQYIQNNLLPTPQAQEGEKITGTENQDSLTKRARLMTGQTSQLNPLFVEEMMGFPLNWTALPFQSGGKNQSKDMEMQ